MHIARSELLRLGPDAVGVVALGLDDMDFYEASGVRWNAILGFDELVARACSEWIDAVVLPHVRSLGGVKAADRHDRVEVLLLIEPPLTHRDVEDQVRELWSIHLGSLRADPGRGPGYGSEPGEGAG